MSGNEILKRVRRQAAEVQIEAYFNPVGAYGHGPGAPVGIWNCQQGVPGRGECPIADNCCYALELCVAKQVSEWSKTLTLNLEETVAILGGKMQFLADRQSEFYLI
ncbi:MAG: hypothetical protein FH749_08770 [Firmicutes bacterium]|nr:hypothetical protein [Bacillota bacterium]